MHRLTSELKEVREAKQKLAVQQISIDSEKNQVRGEAVLLTICDNRYKHCYFSISSPLVLFFMQLAKERDEAKKEGEAARARIESLQTQLSRARNEIHNLSKQLSEVESEKVGQDRHVLSTARSFIKLQIFSLFHEQVSFESKLQDERTRRESEDQVRVF